jgi:hypothetical protein
VARLDELAASEAAGVALVVAAAFFLERLGIWDFALEQPLDALVVRALDSELRGAPEQAGCHLLEGGLGVLVTHRERTI